MARTQAEVRAFLDSLVGSKVINKPDRDYDGQCVTLIKALMEFLGVANPYAARGDAKILGDALIRQGIGREGRGWLTVVVNRDMGVINGKTYGHVWTDLLNEANYESNGNRALHVTKNTRPINQGQQFINLDQWIKEGSDVMDAEDVKEIYRMGLHREPENNNVVQANVGKKFSDVSKSVRKSPEWLTQNHMVAFFNQRESELNIARSQLVNANNQLKAALENDAADKAAIQAAQKKAADALANLDNVTKDFNTVKAELDAAKADKETAEKTGNAFLRWLGEQLNKIMGGK